MAWVVTAYNVAVAAAALGLVLFVHRLNATKVLVDPLIRGGIRLGDVLG